MNTQPRSAVKTALMLLQFVLTVLSPSLLSAPAEAQSGFTTPFTLTNDHIVIAALVKGQGPFQFLVDTAATANILSGSLVQGLAAPMDSPVSVNGFGATETSARQTRPVPVSIDGVAQPDQSFISLDSALQIVKTDIPIQGVFGLPLLQKQVVLIDFAKNQISGFSPQLAKSAWPILTGSITLPLTFMGDGIALMPAAIDGVSGNFQLDTGSNASVILFSQFAQARPDKFAPPATPAKEISPQFGGAVQLQSIGQADILIGKLHGTVSRVITAASTPPSAIGKDIAGSIGLALLKHFKLLIDFPDATLTLSPSPSDNPPAAR